MTKLTIEIETPAKLHGDELAHNLDRMADQLRDMWIPIVAGVIRDVNGNRIGQWSVSQ